MDTALASRVLLPGSLAETVELLGRHPGAVVLGGGTDVMVAVNTGVLRPAVVVALSGVPELRGWRYENGWLLLGACLTYRQMTRPELAAVLPILAQAAHGVGTPAVRNSGTLGGAIVTAAPGGDLLPVLVALDAEVICQSPAGSRVLQAADLASGRVRVPRGELVTAVRMRVPSGPQQVCKVAAPGAPWRPVASVALIADTDCQSVRCAVGGAFPVVTRAWGAELALITEVDWATGRLGDPAMYETFGPMVAATADPLDDALASAAYRRRAVAVCARTVLRRVFPEGAPTS